MFPHGDHVHVPSWRSCPCSLMAIVFMLVVFLFQPHDGVMAITTVSAYRQRHRLSTYRNCWFVDGSICGFLCEWVHAFERLRETILVGECHEHAGCESRDKLPVLLHSLDSIMLEYISYIRFRLIYTCIHIFVYYPLCVCRDYWPRRWFA